MPFSAFVLITMAAVSGLEGAAAVTPFTLMTAAFYPIALFLVFAFAVATGAGPHDGDGPNRRRGRVLGRPRARRSHQAHDLTPF